MKIDGLTIYVNNLVDMKRFYTFVFGFEVKGIEHEMAINLVKEDLKVNLITRSSLMDMMHQRFVYFKGINGTFEISLRAKSFEEVDKQFYHVVSKGAQVVLMPTTLEEMRLCYISDPEGNMIKIFAEK